MVAVAVTACSGIVGETPIETTPGDSAPGVTSTTSSERSNRDCVAVTGSANRVDTGGRATDALFLSGELFVCADDVVVVGEGDLNEVAAAAQLAAALGGPLLYSHPQVPAEVGRLKPLRVHLVGGVEVMTPPDAVVLQHGIKEAVETAREALDVSEEVLLPVTPDASTIVATVLAITARDRVVVPQVDPGTTPPGEPSIDTGEVVVGLGTSSDSASIWIVDAGDPMTILLAAATGRSVAAAAVAIDPEDLLGHAEVGEALTGRTTESIRYVGSLPEGNEWQLAVLANGVQVPGGGFYILPKNAPRRYVAFYGHPDTTALGALGEQGPEATLYRMEPLLRAYEGDGSQVIPTFEMIASVASAGPTDDGDYSYEWPTETFDDWVRVAKESGAYIILDLQSGRDDFLTQAKLYTEMLELPFVGLALDPEWRLRPDQVHLKQVGTVSATEINEVIHWLADLVRSNGLPQKMLIVHQFRTTMVQDRHLLEHRPELQLIIQMDGDGTEPQKDNTWRQLREGAEDAFWAWGWKNFFDEDEPTPTPESTMSKEPAPVYVSYQ